MNIEALKEVIKQEFNKWDLELKKIEHAGAEGVVIKDFFKKRLHSFRWVFEPYIFHTLILRYGKQLEEHWRNYLPPIKSENAFVVIERRCHPNFWFVLRNIAWANPNMSVYIVCSDENEGFVRELLGNKVDNFHILRLFHGEAVRDKAIKDYNHLLTNYNFYDNFINNNVKYILTIQMDLFIRKKISDDMFVGDYWGAPWGWNTPLPGGSGATIRNVNRLKELCLLHRPDPKDTDFIEGEDIWFSEKIIELRWNFPNLEYRIKHIMESIPTVDPYIVHQFWTYLEVFRDKFNTPLFTDFLNHILTLDI